MKYSQSTGCAYIPSIHGDHMPSDVVDISQDLYDAVIANPLPGKVRSHDAAGLPILIDPPPHITTDSELCLAIDTAADAARLKVAGDPLRAVEYDRAAAEAQAFADAGYAGPVPPMVAAWATSERTAQQAAENILAESAQYSSALVQLRTVRLQAKEQIRALMAAEQIGQAQQLAEQTVATINAAVAGIGNNT
jgi:hypothetical protein